MKQTVIRRVCSKQDKDVHPNHYFNCLERALKIKNFQKDQRKFIFPKLKSYFTWTNNLLHFHECLMVFRGKYLTSELRETNFTTVLHSMGTLHR